MKIFSKTLIFIKLAVLIAIPSGSVNAQVQVTLHQPPTDQFYFEHLWNIDIINTLEETLRVYLRGTVTEAKDGLILEATSTSFSLPPGFRRISAGEISPIDVNYSNKKYEDIIQQTGSFPEGDYTVCIYVINEAYEEELGNDCIEKQVAHPSPPQLILPMDGAKVEEEFPVFTWMPPMGLLPGQTVTFSLNIVEILDGQTPIDAIQSNPPWLEEDGIISTSFIYQVSARALEADKNYCWQVIPWLYDLKLEPSEVWSFTVIGVVAPPQLINPANGEEVTEPNPLFEWTPSVGPYGETVDYSLKIFVVPEELSPEEAIEEGIPWFEKDSIDTTFLLYPPTAKPFEQGEEYAWQVGTFGQFSEIYDFYFFPSFLPVVKVIGRAGLFKIEKKVNTEQAKVGDTLTYTLRIISKSNIEIPKFVIEDLIPPRTEFIPGSVSVSTQSSKGGKHKPLREGKDYTVEIKDGKLKIEINNSIFKDKEFLITFKVKITSYPKSGLIKNDGITLTVPKFNYNGATIGPSTNKFKKGTETTVPPRYKINKKVTPAEVGPGDYITYTITIENQEDHEIEVTLYELIPGSTRYVGPATINGKTIKPEEFEGKDLESYLKFKVKIPAKKKITITLRFKVLSYGDIKNYIYSSEPPKDANGSTSDGSATVKSTKEMYIKNTYTRELRNIIEHKEIANKLHNIDSTLEFIKNRKKSFEHKCPDGTKIKINLTFNWGKTPRICDDRIKGETQCDEEYSFDPDKKTITFKKPYKIEYECIFEYDQWRENKALFFHEILHIQLQLDNWNSKKWWADYCKKLKAWNWKDEPPAIQQSAEEDHKIIGKDDTQGLHKKFLDELKKSK